MPIPMWWEKRVRLFERDDERQKEMGDVRATGLGSWTTVAPSAYMSKVGIPAWDRPAANDGGVSHACAT